MDELYKVLGADKEAFEIQDFGSGSRVLSRKRSVADMLKTSSSKGIYGNVLWQLGRFFRPQTVLELGTNIGIGTLHLSEPTNTTVYTVEGCEQTQRAAIRTFSAFRKENVISFLDTFDAFLERPGLPVFDLVFLDGNHSGEATLRYLSALEKLSHNETLFILDDIRWSNDMWLMWRKLVQHPDYHVTVDLGRMGLAWKRPQQQKEHFVIRPRTFKTKLL